MVTCIPHMFPRDAAQGNYKIVAAMPDRDGDHIYRIKSPLEEYERVVGENLLVRSDECLPAEVREQSLRRGSITLPKLRIALRVEAEESHAVGASRRRKSSLRHNERMGRRSCHDPSVIAVPRRTMLMHLSRAYEAGSAFGFKITRCTPPGRTYCPMYQCASTSGAIVPGDRIVT